MNVLFIHQNFPGQFIHLAAELARNRRNKVVALTIHQQAVPPGVILRPYSLLRNPVDETHPLLKDQEAKVLRAEACAAQAMQLKREGFVPDVIIAHSGWGEALFMKDVFPTARLVVYAEFYYAAEGRDVGFDPEIPPLQFPQRCQLRLRNTTSLLTLDAADLAISPTQWQKSTYPPQFHDKIHVIHDGIDCSVLKPNPKARIRVAAHDGAAGGQFQPGAEVLSYVARNLEAVRGFHQFMRVLPKVLARRPQAHAFIVGGSGLSYGCAAPGGQSWKEAMLDEVGASLDLRRVHFVGKIAYPTYLDLLNVSKVHAYWTTPFVLSWSCLEAAVHGVPVVASATPPVLEFADGLGMQTPDFFDQEGFADAICHHLASPAVPRRNRATPDTVDLKTCVARQLALISE